MESIYGLRLTSKHQRGAWLTRSRNYVSSQGEREALVYGAGLRVERSRTGSVTGRVEIKTLSRGAEVGGLDVDTINGLGV
jgi:hypothetical protein